MRTDFTVLDAKAGLEHIQQALAQAAHGALPVLDGEHLHGLLRAADVRAALFSPATPAGDSNPQLIHAGQLAL